MSGKAVQSWLRLVVLAVGVLWIAGCASKPKVDWSARVGVYTFDQAVGELGPPDKSSKLSDGSTVADWYQGRASSVSFGFGVGSYGRGGGVGVGQGVTTGGDARYLRLTFGPDGKLTHWERT